MNRERIEAAIRVMERAQNLNMHEWQFGDSIAKSVEELHKCGNAACFAGYLAVSEEFKAAGGTASEVTGRPEICVQFDWEPLPRTFIEDTAIAWYLDISRELAYSIVYGYIRIVDPATNIIEWVDFYPVAFNEVKPEHVIYALRALLAGEFGEQKFELRDNQRRCPSKEVWENYVHNRFLRWGK